MLFYLWVKSRAEEMLEWMEGLGVGGGGKINDDDDGDDGVRTEYLRNEYL